MHQLVKNLLKFFEDFFFPSVCEGCGKVGMYLCSACRKEFIHYIECQQCHVCKKKVKSKKVKGKNLMIHNRCGRRTRLDGVFVVAKYSKFIENYLGDIKYEFYYSMIDDIVKIMIAALSKNIFFMEVIKGAIITFVPLNSWRRRWRGFNQSEKIAQKIASYFKIDCIKLLDRVKRTKTQVGLKREERLENIKNAFKIRNGIMSKFNTVIIVDDIITSGATLEECAKVLKRNGIQEVYGLVLARG